MDAPPFQHVTTEDGLSQGTALALAQDSSGFLWIGTQLGLNRYDGREVRRYLANATDPNALPADVVRALLVAPGGTLWIGTSGAGLVRRDAERNAFVRLPLVLPPLARGESPDTVTIVYDLALQADVLYLATDRGGVRFHPASGQVTPITGGEPRAELSRGRCRTVAVEGAAVFLGCEDGSLHAWRSAGGNTTELRHVRTLALGSRPFSLQAIAPDTILVGASGGLFTTDSLLTRLVPLPLPQPEFQEVADFVQDVLRDRRGRTWVGTRHGLVELGGADPPTRHLAYGLDPTSLAHNEVWTLLEDRTGNLWVGTFDGLSRLSRYRSAIRRVVGSPNPRGTLGSGGVLAIERDARGGLWLGLQGGDLNRILPDGRIGTFRPDGTPPGAVGGDVVSLSTTPAGSVWTAVLGAGLFRLDPDGGSLARFGNPLHAEHLANAVSVLARGDEDVWVGTASGGLFRLDARQGLLHPALSGATMRLGEPYVWPIREGVRGEIWFGTSGARGGVHRLARGGGLDSWAHDPAASGAGLGDGRVLTVLLALSGHVWIGTMGGGLYRLDPERGAFRHWGTGQGLPHDVVEGLLEDDRGHIWITTDGGLARLDPETGDILRFVPAVGLQAVRFFANAAYRDASGLLYFGGPGGLNIVDPAELPSPAPPPPVEVIRFAVFGEERPRGPWVQGGERMELGPRENFFSVEFAALDFLDPGANRYRYRLEGLDPDWVELGNARIANYTSVPPGTYTLRLTAANAEGTWNEAGLSIPLIVHPPFYATWWFRLLLAVLLAAAVLGAYALRMRQLARVAAMRLRIAGELHDDIGANLSAIALKSELARRVALEEPRRRRSLDDIERLARDTTHKVREMIWVVKEEHDSLEGLLVRMEDAAGTLLEGVLHHEMRVPRALPHRRIGMELRQDVYSIFKEILQNVLKHSGASQVQIDVSYRDPYLTFAVEDDGRGFDPASAKRGNGLGLMELRTKKHGARLDIGRSAHGGTRVELKVRVG